MLGWVNEGNTVYKTIEWISAQLYLHYFPLSSQTHYASNHKKTHEDFKKVLIKYVLTQSAENFFCKEPESNYFILDTHCLSGSSQRQFVNEYSVAISNKYLQKQLKSRLGVQAIVR